MPVDRDAAFERFLVEDVILTLGNLRGSLGWLESAEARADPAIYRAGLRRIDRQIELLEERARSLRAAHRGAAGPADLLPVDSAPQVASPGVAAPVPAAAHPAAATERPPGTAPATPPGPVRAARPVPPAAEAIPADEDDACENVFAVDDVGPASASQDASRAQARVRRVLRGGRAWP